MKTIGKLAAAAVLSVSALAVTATSASAEIVCNRDGYCWHVRKHYDFKPEFGIVVHEDS